MQTVKEMTANSGVNVPDTPRNIVTPKLNHSALELQDQEINTERRQKSDAVSHQTLNLVDSVGYKAKDLGQQLVDKRDKIPESVNLDKGLGSALARLPDGVLSKIFDYHLMDSDHLSRRSDPSPMQLARVCRRWRDVAVGMAKLWCKLSFYVDDDRKEWRRSAFYYDSWLKRSQDRPLSLQLRPGYAEGGTAKLRRLVQPYMSRVSSLDITFWDDLEPEPLLTDLPAALHELTVCFGDWFDASATAQSLSQVPSTVRSLKILDRTFGPDCLLSLNPLILGQPAFMSLRVQCMRFTHANLQSLRFICPGYFETNPLPGTLCTLEIRYGFLSSPHQELEAFLERSKCPLEILIFNAVVTPPPDQQGDFIAIIPSLKIECRLDTGSK
ncbi:hypothetical protein F4604DRAFT_1804089 [Suillus subluteus]|nr:hypothetical protein F4604DRAFT_1804089 [Suillus subluteus]